MINSLTLQRFCDCTVTIKIPKRALFYFVLHARGSLWPDMETTCAHQFTDTSRPWANISETKSVSLDIAPNHTHLFYFENYAYIDSDRKIVFRLEACTGNVTLWIRRTRPCWPNPQTGDWTHFKGEGEGILNVLELPSASTKWFITVFGRAESRYTLTVIPDSRSYPLITQGDINATQISRDSVELRWLPASRHGILVSKYLVYSSMWFEGAPRILTTVCGLEQNTDHAYAIVDCAHACNVTIKALTNGRKYFFNIIAFEGAKAPYGGIIYRTWWDESFKLDIEGIGSWIATVLGTITVILLITYAILHQIFVKRYPIRCVFNYGTESKQLLLVDN